MADGGGICISGTAYDHIENKLALGYNFMGKHSVKNIAKPVRVYKVPMDPRDVGKKRVGKSWKKVALAAAIVLILGTVAFAVWNFYLRPPQIEPASLDKMAFPLPEKPSIAVLPFVNMSGDPKQDYIADGISENIISALSKIGEIFVIARNSTFTYKNKAIKVQQVAEDLGVRYVLEGSVLKSGDKIRITAQLANWVYIIQSESKGRYYCGQSSDVERRLRQHNDPEYRLSKTTKRFNGPWVLVWKKKCATRSKAMKLEKKIKKRGISRFLKEAQ